MDELIDRQPTSPPGRFEIGLRRKVGYITETEIGQHFDRRGNAKHPLQRRMVQDADPSDSDPLRPRRQPEILNRAAGTIQIGIAHRGTPQHVPATALAGAGHAKIHRRLFDALELEAAIEIGSGSCISGRRPPIHFIKQRLDLSFRGRFSDNHKVPRLHESDRAGMMRRGQQSHQHIVRNRRRQIIPADIPALEDRPVHRLSLKLGESDVGAHQPFHLSTLFSDRPQLAGADFPQTYRAETVFETSRNPIHLSLRDADLSAPALVSATLEGLSAVLASLGDRPSHNSTPG